MNGTNQSPTTSLAIVRIVVFALAIVTLFGFTGTIYLCRTSNDPLLVATAAKMIQTDPSSAMAALLLLRSDAAIIAIVSNLTGVALGSLGSVLSNARTQAAHPPGGQTDISSISTTTTETTKTASTPPAVPAVPTTPIPVEVVNEDRNPVPVTPTTES